MLKEYYLILEYSAAMKHSDVDPYFHLERDGIVSPLGAVGQASPYLPIPSVFVL